MRPVIPAEVYERHVAAARALQAEAVADAIELLVKGVLRRLRRAMSSGRDARRVAPG